MNLFNKNFSKGLSILISSFVLFSCHDNEVLNNPIEGIEPGAKVRYMEINVPYEKHTIPLSSINTTSASRWLVGKYSDENIGSLENKSYAMISRRSELDTLKGISMPSKARTLVSFDLVLRKDNYALVKDADEKQDIKVFQLASPLESKTHYASESETLGNLLGEKKGFSEINTDTLRIKLDDAVGKAFFEKLENSRIDTVQSDLNAYFKGIALTSGDQSTGIHGFSRASSALVFKYKYYATDTSKTELEAEKVFTFSNYKKADDANEYATSYNSFKRLSAIASTKVIMQSGYGFYPVLDLSVIEDSLATKENIVLNAIQLDVKTERLDGRDLFPPSSIFFSFVDKEKNNSFIKREHTQDTTKTDFFFYLTKDVVLKPMGTASTAYSPSVLNVELTEARLEIGIDRNAHAYTGAANIFSQALIGTYKNTLKERDLIRSPSDAIPANRTLDQAMLLSDDFDPSTNSSNTLNYIKVEDTKKIRLKVYYSEITKEY